MNSCRLALALVFASALLTAAAAQTGADGLLREQRLRAWALRPSLAEPEFQAALDSSDWTLRHAALEALARARPGALEPGELDFVIEFLDDPQPNVRATALAVCARFSLALPAKAQSLATDHLAEVRRQYARALARAPGDSSAELSLLMDDADKLVAREALSAWLVAPGSGSLGELGRSDPSALRIDDLSFDDFARAARGVVRVGNEAARLRLADHLRNSQSTVQRAYYLAALSSLWGPLSRDGEPSPLVALWLVRCDPPGSPSEGEVREQLVEAAARFSWASCASLFELALACEERGATEDADHCLAGVLAAVTGSGQGAWVSDLAAHGFGPASKLRMGRRLALEFWEGLRGAPASLDADALEVWLAADLPLELRAAVTTCAADTWWQHGDPGAARILARALEAEEEALRRAALVALVGTSEGELGDLPAVNAAVLDAWSRATLDQRLELLRDFRRGVPRSAAWRAALAELWTSGAGRVVSVPELLSACVQDSELAGQLHGWLRHELDLLEAGEVPEAVPAEKRQRGPWREAETRALWLLKAWTQVGEHRDLQASRALLLRVDGLGRELTKTLVSSLAKTNAGGEELAQLFANQPLARRTRIEIALVSGALGDQARRALLLASYATCDEALRLRILECAAKLGGEEARALLLTVALADGASAAEAVVALDALGRAGSPEEVRHPLERVALFCSNLDQRRAAIERLGAKGDGETGALLWSALQSDPHAPYLRDELLPAIARIQLRSTGRLSHELAELWCAAPRERAAQELRRRFRGEALANPAFLYSDVLGVAQAAALFGRLGEILPVGWESWDARLLLELAEVASGAGHEELGPRGLVREMVHAGLVGLLGEGPTKAQKTLILGARVRLLELALVAGDWREVEGWANCVLEEWRTGRISSGAMRSVLGPLDARAGRAPTAWLRATAAQARAWLALAAGDLEAARRQASAARRMATYSHRARPVQRALERALGTPPGDSYGDEER